MASADRTHAERRLDAFGRDGLLEFWELEDALVRGGLADALEARGMEVQWTCGGWHVERDGKVFETGPMAMTRNEVVAVSFETTMRLKWILSFLSVLPELPGWLPACRGRKSEAQRCTPRPLRNRNLAPKAPRRTEPPAEVRRRVFAMS